MCTAVAAKIAAVACKTPLRMQSHKARSLPNRGVSQVVHVYSRKMSRLPELIRQQRKRALGQPRTGRMSLVMTDIQGFTKLMQGDADQTTQVRMRTKARRRVDMTSAAKFKSVHTRPNRTKHRAEAARLCVSMQAALLATMSRRSAPAKIL